MKRTSLKQVTTIDGRKVWNVSDKRLKTYEKQSAKMRKSKRDFEEYKRAVNTYNRRRDYLIKKNPEYATILPDRIKPQKSFKEIETRYDFRNEIRRLSNFTKKGSETIITNANGLKITKWEKRELELGVKRLNTNRILGQLYKDKIIKSTYGKSEHVKIGELPNTRDIALTPKDFDLNKFDKRREFEKFRESVERQQKMEWINSKLETYKDNLITALGNSFNSSADDIIDKVENLYNTDKEKFRLICAGELVAEIGYVYSHEQEEEELEKMRNTWEKFEKMTYEEVRDLT